MRLSGVLDGHLLTGDRYRQLRGPHTVDLRFDGYEVLAIVGLRNARGALGRFGVRGLYIMRVTHRVREALRLARNAGWVHVRTTGSHRQFKHPLLPGTITIAGKPSDDLHPKTWKSIVNLIQQRPEEESRES